MKQSKQPKIFTESLFRVVQACKFTDFKRFKKAIEHKGYSLETYAQFSLDEELSKLEKLWKYEENINKADMERANGKDVLYGQSIMLLHLNSGLYVCASRQNSRTQRDALKLILTATPTSKSLFHMSSPFRFKGDGETILYIDRIRVLSKKLHVNLNRSNDMESNEVVLSNIKNVADWRIKNYSQHVTVQGDVINVGHVVRLFHNELGKFVSLNDDFELEFCEPNQLDVYGSSSLWEIENEDITTGGLLHTLQTYKIRNFISKRYLHLKPNKITVDEQIATPRSPREALRKKAIREKSQAPKQVENTYFVEMMEECDDSWQFVPAQKQMGNIFYGSLVRLRHKNSAFLHVNDKNDFSGSSKLFDEDVFTISRVDIEEVKSFLFVQSVLPNLKSDMIGTLDRMMNMTNEIFSLRKQQFFQKLLIQVLNMLESSTIDKYESFSYSKRKEFQLIKLCYEFITHACKKQEENGLFCYKYLTVFQKHLFSDLGALEALLAIYKNNRLILYSITEKEVDYYVNAMGILKDRRLLLLLSSLCAIKNQPVPSNQNMILDRMLQHHLFFTPLKDKTKIIMQTQGMEFDFDQILKNRRLLDYYVDLVYLMSLLTLGRNKNSISEVSKIYNLKTLEKIFASQIPSQLKSGVIYLYTNLFINVDPFQKKSLITLTRGLQKEISVGTKNLLDIQKFIELKKNLIGYLASEDAEYLSSVLILIKNLLKFGIFDTQQEYKALIPEVIELLGKSIVPPYHLQIEICKVLNLFFDHFIEQCITQYLEKFKRNEQGHQIDKKIFKDIPSLLMNLLQYPDKELQTHVLAVLMRYYTLEDDFVKNLGRVDLLSNSMQVPYKKMNELVNKFQNLMSQNLSLGFEEEERFQLEFLQVIKALVGEMQKNPLSQKILKNLRFHEIVIEVLQKPLQQEMKQVILPKIFVVLREFVKNNNVTQNLFKNELENIINLIHDFKIDFVTPFLIECVRDNFAICNSFSEKMIQSLLSNIGRGIPGNLYMDLLYLIISPNRDTLIERNQLIVIKEIFERKAEVVLLFNDADGQKLRNQLIDKQEYKSNNGKLNYHISLLRLLIKCSAGKIHFSEVKIQSLFAIEEVISHINDEETAKVPRLKSTLLSFLDEVYINIARPNAKRLDNKALWKLFDSLLSEVNAFLDLKLKDGSYIFGTVIPLMSNFFWCYKDHIAKFTDITIIWYKTLVSLYSKVSYQPHRNTILICLKSLQVVVGSQASEDKNLDAFISGHQEDEIPALYVVTSLLEDSDQILKRSLSKIEILANGHGLLANSLSKENITHIIKFILSMKSSLDKQNLNKLVIFVIKTFQEMLRGARDKFQAQNNLVECGSEKFLLELMTCSNTLVVKEIIDFGILLVQGGNKFVQKKIFEHLKQDTYSTFFLGIKDLIKKSKNEIKESKAIFKKKETDITSLKYFYTKELFRLLQLFCEGHNLVLQKILYGQEGILSVNLVSEVLEYTIELHRYLHQKNIELAYQCFETMTEFLQGPCEENQKFLNNTKLYFMANDILSNEFLDSGKHLNHREVVMLKSKIMLCLLSIASETINPEITDLMIKSIKPHLLETGIHHIDKNSTNQNFITELTQSGFKDADIKEIFEIEEHLGYQYYILLKILSETDSGFAIRKMFHKKCFQKFINGTGNIEVVRSGKLDRIYFRIPEISHSLTRETKIHFLHHCDRETPQKKVEELFNEAPKFKSEMEYYHDLKFSAIFTLLKPVWPYFQTASLLLAYCINILIILCYGRVFDVRDKVPIPGIDDTMEWPLVNGEFLDTYSEDLYLVFSYMHLALQLFLLLLHIIYKVPLRVRASFAIPLKEKWKDQKVDGKFIWTYFKFALRDSYLWTTLFCTAVALLGIIVHPLFWAIQLLEIIILSKILRSIIRAVTSKVQVLAITGALLVVFVFSFSAIYFNSFSDDFVVKPVAAPFSIPDANQIGLCDTYFNCVFNLLNYGIRYKFYIENIIPATSKLDRFIVDLLFKIIVIILLMDIVFGLILESYSNLREDSLKLEEEIRSQCFICNIHKGRFDSKAGEGVTFFGHILNDHFVWNYVSFLVYLYQKDATEFTGIEQYMHDMVEKGDLTFFPVLRSMALEKLGDVNEQENDP